MLEARREVLHDHDRQGEVRRKLGEDPCERRGPPVDAPTTTTERAGIGAGAGGLFATSDEGRGSER